MSPASRSHEILDPGSVLPSNPAALRPLSGCAPTRAQRHLTEAPLRVSSELWETPLASPLRRALALALDFVLLLVPTVVVAAGAAPLALRLQDPAAFRALRTSGPTPIAGCRTTASRTPW